MRGDALYMHLIGKNDELYKRMEELVKANYKQLYTRLQGFSFFITEKQLQTLPLKFRSGSAERLLDIMRQLRSPLYPMIAGIVSEDYLFFTTLPNSRPCRLLCDGCDYSFSTFWYSNRRHPLLFHILQPIP